MRVIYRAFPNSLLILQELIPGIETNACLGHVSYTHSIWGPYVASFSDYKDFKGHSAPRATKITSKLVTHSL